VGSLSLPRALKDNNQNIGHHNTYLARSMDDLALDTVRTMSNVDVQPNAFVVVLTTLLFGHVLPLL
jgi:hypothetical protein